MPEAASVHSGAIGLLADCIVLIGDAANPQVCGSGFFIAPGVVLTCAHVANSCGPTPRIEFRGRFVTAERTVVALDPIGATKASKYTSFPDLAMLFVPFTDHPCAWLDRRQPDKDDHLTVVTGFDVQFASGPAPLDLRFCRQTEAHPATTLWATAAGGKPYVVDGMSGSPVLDPRTHRVTGVVKASDGRGVAHVVPIVSALAHLVASGNYHDSAAPAEPEDDHPQRMNPIIEVWHAHDRYHAEAQGPAAGTVGRWPEFLDRSAGHAEGAWRPPASALTPAREAGLFGLLAGVEESSSPWAAAELFEEASGLSAAEVFPGPIQCLRDAAWHLATQGGDVAKAFDDLNSLVRRVADRAAESSAAALKAWANVLSSGPERDGPSGQAVRSADADLGQTARGVDDRWPAGVIVLIEPSSAHRHRYRTTIWISGTDGHWICTYAPDQQSYRFDVTCHRLKEPLAAALGRLKALHAVVEFCVPPELFDHPYDAERVINARPLGEMHPVVVRDYETVVESSLRHYAFLTWERIEQNEGQPPAALRCDELPASEDEADRLRDLLDGDPPPGRESLAGRLILLPGPVAPGAQAERAMRVLRQTWGPLAIWSRTPCPHDPVAAMQPCSGAQFTASAAAGVDEVPLHALPAAVNRLRENARKARRQLGAQPSPQRDSAESGGDTTRMSMDNLCLADAVLYWDPPHRIPAQDQFVVPGAV